MNSYAIQLFIGENVAIYKHRMLATLRFYMSTLTSTALF